MSKSSVLCAVFALVVCGAQADAAQPSASKMSQMGLSGATVVSDSDALAVRGFGYRGGNKVTIYGHSEIEVKVRYGPVTVKVESENGYHSTTGGSQIGANVSVVGATVLGGGGPTPIIFAGGASGVWVGGRR